ncbi:MAG: hypothetical protein SFX73_17980 [Kofleriaceae bacterium]|nr:hypothetical protein [Kofleriaceae bacterium]
MTLLLGDATALLACPSCPAGRAARLLVFSDAFWVNAWFALLPFVVCGLVVRAVVRRLNRGEANDAT